jgi:hypothetical protein
LVDKSQVAILEEISVKRCCFSCLIGILSFLTACNSANTDIQKSGDPKNYETIAAEKYGDNIEYIFNSPKTHVICLKRNKPSPQIPQNQISFFIYDLKNGEIIFEESSIDAEVRWKSEDQVEVRITPGIVSGEETAEDFIYVYDVISRKKIK